MKFTHSKWGYPTELEVGQKVKCIYYHESIQWDRNGEKDWKTIFGYQPFTPVKNGIIVGDAGIRPYYLSSNEKGTEQYLYVKFDEYFFKKAIPISCISDAKSSAENTIRFLWDNVHKIGQPGYDIDSYIALEQMAKEALSFCEK